MQKTIKRLNFTGIILLILLTITSCKKTSKLNVTVKSIDITLQETKLEVGKEITIVANIIPTDATNKNMTWNSSNPDIASIDKTGKVHAIKKGKTTITVTTEDGKKSDKIELSIFEKEIKVESISITNANSTLEIGKEITIVTNILPINATNKNMTWNSSNPDIASIDKTGKVHAIKEGKTTITVTTQDSNKSDKVELSIFETVKEIKVESISITNAKSTLEIGKELTIVANILPINATNKNMTWNSSNPDIASIDKTGKVHAIKKGKTIISVTTEDGKKSDIIELSVFEKEIKVESISITNANSTLEIGKEITIVANILPINATNKNITWNSSNPEIASIDKTGKVHAIKKGKTIISVTTEDGKKTNSYEISIKEKVILIKTISLIYNGEAIKKGDIINLTVNILPDNATDKNLKWESNTPDIASVNENGEVSFIKDGKVTITATNTDNSVKGLIELETTVEKICNIPDANFKTALINYWVSNSEKLDTNGDGEISHTEARSISHLDIWNKNISDLTGIENFVNITHLNCYKNNLINIDISKCTNIIDLRCGYNQIENIDLSNSSNLEHLNIYHNLCSFITLLPSFSHIHDASELNLSI